VKSWNEMKGFGFIVPSGGGDDVYAHRTVLVAACDRPSLARGMRVAYDVGTGQLASRATRVTQVDGSAIAENYENSDRGGGGYGGGGAARSKPSAFQARTAPS
jgi:CspA family cold shock protein